ncbi:MAG: phosphotransferase [Acidobacteria bacterium]|nr:phosphotransferase [Acidobacteriota bacterium]
MTEFRRTWPDWDAVAAAIPPEWLREQRWFQRKAATVDQVRLLDVLKLDDDPPSQKTPRALLVVDIRVAGGPADVYLLPVSLRVRSGRDLPGFAVNAQTVAVDALADGVLHAAVRRRMGAGEAVAARKGSFRGEGRPYHGSDKCRVLAQTSSNSVVRLGDDEVLKYIRRLEPGENPELEMSRFFATHGDFTNLPALRGALHYKAAEGREFTLALALDRIAHDGDAWHWFQDQLAELLDSLPMGAAAIAPRILDEAGGTVFRGAMTRLAAVLGHMHRVLCSGAGGPDFAPESIRPADLAGWSAALVRSADDLFDRLARMDPGDDTGLREFLAGLPRLREQVRQACERISRLQPEGLLKCRVHGDFHLGQVLRAGSDFYIIDFEGEPLRDRDERRAKQSPLKDVAGLCRSLNYAIYAALFAWRDRARPSAVVYHSLERTLPVWGLHLEETFLAEYGAATGRPATPARRMLLAAHKLEKALYELDYEINNRPGWLPIPARGIGDCLDELLP